MSRIGSNANGRPQSPASAGTAGYTDRDREWLMEWWDDPDAKHRRRAQLSFRDTADFLWNVARVPHRLHRFRECVEEGRTYRAAYQVARSV